MEPQQKWYTWAKELIPKLKLSGNEALLGISYGNTIREFKR